ncbi:hypothetical protein HDV01_007399, partial [Terramyces sp. JEL0728]
IKITSENKSYLLRLSKTTWPKEKIINEIAVLEYLKSTTIKCPSVYSYGFGVVYWILMEFIEGRMLELDWRNLDKSTKQVLVKQIGSQLEEIQSLKFPTVSGWGLNGGKPVLAKYFDGNYEYPSEKDFIIGEYDRNLEKLKSRMDIEFLLKLKPKIQDIISRLEPVPTVLFHGDFAFRNMIYKDQELVCILDWEWAGTRPCYMDLQENLLEENDEQDEIENEWIKQEFKKFDYPNQHERKVLLELVDATAEWRFSSDNAISRLHAIVEKTCLMDYEQQIVPLLVLMFSDYKLVVLCVISLINFIIAVYIQLATTYSFYAQNDQVMLVYDSMFALQHAINSCCTLWYYMYFPVLFAKVNMVKKGLSKKSKLESTNVI